MTPRTEEDITVLTAGIPSQYVDLRGRTIKRVIGDHWMRAEKAEFIQQTVPGESGGKSEIAEEKKWR